MADHAGAAAAVAALEKARTRKELANLKRFDIDAPNAGVSMANIQKIAKPLGRDHRLAGPGGGPGGTRPACWPRW